MAETGQKSEDQKDESQISADAPGSAEEELEPIEELPSELDEDELNSYLAKHDPEFTQSVAEIGLDKSLFVNDLILSSEEQELAEEVFRWQNSKGLRGKIYLVLPFMPRVFLWLRKTKFKIFLGIRSQWVKLKNFGYFLTTAGKDLLVLKVKAGVHAVKNSVDIRVDNYRKLSVLHKAYVFLIVAGMVVTGAFVYRSLTTGIIPAEDQLFIPSMESLASEVYEYDPETETEPLYDNLRATQNFFLLPKIVVNLRREPGSKKVPMAAFELFLEGGAPEVIVEVKDREAAIKDLVQRVIEDYTFETLDTTDGKLELCKSIQKAVSAALTTGSIKKVLIKTIVLKP
jgi:flagellar basal body-associated protein FliL